MPEVQERLRRASQHVTLPDQPLERMLRRRDRKRRNERLTAAVVALVVTLGVMGTGLGLLSGLGGGSADIRGRDPATEELIRGLALSPGEYFYLRIASSESADGYVRDEQTWWTLDDSGVVRNRSTRRDKYPNPPSGEYGRGEFPAEMDVSKLSTEPERLASQLSRQTPWAEILDGTPEPQRMWSVIRILLLEAPNVAPDLRAALFEVASGLDGVTVITSVEDPAGRRAIALQFTAQDDDPPITWKGFFDPDTHQLMAWTSVYDGAHSWTLLDAGVVHSAGTFPRGSEWLFAPSAP